jgi:hypothetical protein
MPSLATDWHYTSRTISLLQLPTELLHEIAYFSEFAELVACCRVSKRLNSVLTVFLYRAIQLVEPLETVLCSKTLNSNVVAASMVKGFTIDLIDWCVPADDTKSIYT